MAKVNINFSRGLSIDGLSVPDITTFDAEMIWGITLGDEEPAWRRYANIGNELSPDVKKYNETYYLETGYEMKPFDETNRTEFWVFLEWLNEKSVWAYNYMYDYVKKLVPHAVVFQYMIMPPAWGFGEDYGAAYELKGEGFAMDCYYATNQPMLLYETVRSYRTAMPDKLFHFDIWGTIWDFLNEAGDGLYCKEGSYEQIRQETWISYLASVDALGYFDWAPENNDSYVWKVTHDRTDIMGKRNWRYIDNFAGQLQLLPSCIRIIGKFQALWMPRIYSLLKIKVSDTFYIFHYYCLDFFNLLQTTLNLNLHLYVQEAAKSKLCSITREQ